ncbi:MAG: 3-coathanger stack domain-containing protein [Bacteroidota bacterium]
MYSNGLTYTSQLIDQMMFTKHAGTNKVKTITDSAPCPDNKVIHQALDNTELHAVATELQADNVVNENADITYQAGTEITLKAGFHAKAGTNFTAKIADCPQSGFETDGFVERSSDDYLYDPNGNQTRDPNKGITSQYNYFNLAYKTTFDNGNVLEWLYLGDGTKVQKVAKRGGVIVSKQDYFNSIEYRNDTLDGIYLEDAKLVFDGGTFEEHQFFIRDNVSNARVIFRDSLGTPTIVNESHYYPNGGLMVGDWQRDSRAKYLFNSIERVNDFGLDVYHAKFRTLDAWTGNWWQVDPKVEQFYAWSPYNLNMRNSVRMSDPDGDNPIVPVAAEILKRIGIWAAKELITRPPPKPPKNFVFRPRPIEVVRDNTIVNSAPLESGVIVNMEGEEGEEIDWEKNPPTTPDELSDDWEDTTDPRKRENTNNRDFTNQKTGEEITFDKGKEGKPGFEGKDHWHRKNPNST